MGSRSTGARWAAATALGNVWTSPTIPARRNGPRKGFLPWLTGPEPGTAKIPS